MRRGRPARAEIVSVRAKRWAGRVAAAILTAGLAVLTTSMLAPAASAASNDGSGTVVIDTNAVADANRVVLDFETPELSVADLVVRVGDELVTADAGPFGRSTALPTGDGPVTVTVTGAAGLDLRVVATYVDATDAVLAHAADRLVLDGADPTNPVDPEPSASPSTDPQPGPTPTLAPTPDPSGDPAGSAAGGDSVASTGGNIPWWAIVVGGVAALAGVVIILVARKRASR